MQFGCRYDDRLAHPAVDMHAENLQVGAAIRFVVPTGNALSAIQVRFNGTMATDSNAMHVRVDLENFHAQFVAEDSRVSEKRLPTTIRMQVRPTDTNPRDPHHGLTGADGSGTFGFRR
jgi:hypothetical protein